MKLPVAVIFYDDDDIRDNVVQKTESQTKKDKTRKEGDENIFIGNILTILYAEREEDSNINLVITPLSSDNKTPTQSSDVTTDGAIFKFLKFDEPSQYGESKLENNKSSINNWVVLRGSGIPFYTEPHQFTNALGHKIDTYGVKLKTAQGTEKVYAGDELLYLRCERIFAEDPASTDDDTARNLKVQKLNGTYWGDQDPFESGILEIYAELDIRTNILTLWVLSTGGKDTVIHERSTLKDWPSTARWQDKYQYDVLYVSRASWKLNNLCEGFDWSK